MITTRIITVLMTASLMGATVPAVASPEPAHLATASNEGQAAQSVAAEIAKADTSHLDGLDNISQHMENLIGAQAMQINILAAALGIFGAIVTLGGLGLVTYARKKIKDAVISSAFEFMKQELNQANYYTNNLNCILHTTLLNVARDLAYNSKIRLGDCVDNNQLNLNTREDVDLFLDSISETFLTPLHIFSTINEIAASRQHTSNVREKIYILYAEVSAGNIETQNILPVIIALKEILENNDSRSPAIVLLDKFSGVLRATPKGSKVPGVPPF